MSQERQEEIPQQQQQQQQDQEEENQVEVPRYIPDPFGVIGVERAGASINEVTVRLVNPLDFAVKIFWLNFQGQRVEIGRVQSFSTFNFTTYHTHPWIFSEKDTGKRVAIKHGNSKSMYFEASSYLNHLESSDPCYTRQMISRLRKGQEWISVCLVEALDSLGLIALRTVKNSLKKREDCFLLQVPDTMQFELANYFL